MVMPRHDLSHPKGLAIIDALGAIAIIAAFETAELSLIALLLAGFRVATLAFFNLCGV
jgi:Na+/H+ antiporter NhaA